MPETSCMKGTSVHIKNVRIKQFCNRKVEMLLRLFGSERFPGLSKNGPLLSSGIKGLVCAKAFEPKCKTTLYKIPIKPCQDVLVIYQAWGQDVAGYGHCPSPSRVYGPTVDAIHKLARQRHQYRAILTEQSWSVKDIFVTRKTTFCYVTTGNLEQEILLQHNRMDSQSQLSNWFILPALVDIA